MQDIFIARSEEALLQLEDSFAQNRDFYLVTLELEDLSSRETLIARIYQSVFDEAPEQLTWSQQMEEIEAEFPEGQKCILSLMDFDDCHSKAQENFLSLAIAYRALGLLLYSEQSLDAGDESLQRLWKVLAKRIEYISAEEISDEHSQYDEMRDDENTDEVFFSDEADSEQENSVQEKVWYQLIPKYHLAGALILFLLVIALWNMDLSGEKQETIAIESITEQNVQETVIEKSIATEQAERVAEEVIEITKPVEQIEQKEIIVEKVDKPVSKAPVVTQPELGKVDWSPYQSEQWIKKQNPQAYTLQILASHSEQGIRDFFREQGVSSQYAVYTIQKDNKPWHIVIYGIYETHEQADQARYSLPAYLKNLSPWIRPLSAIQKSLN